MAKKPQTQNIRLTKEANQVLDKWKKLYGGLNKSEVIMRVERELAMPRDNEGFIY